ncbi:MAG: acetyl-CoA carboxylase carboxyltransferase subunit alpha [Chitinophagaceae bacterium]|nr:MAG: acetyl-CoA carboxylase carboxyltransferase subunit alpha [Chitinophagaceae bacterium]
MSPTGSRHFLDFESNLRQVYEELFQLRLATQKDPKKNQPGKREELEKRLLEERISLTQGLTPWQVVQLSRHPDRPYSLRFIDQLTTGFIEIFGDRKQADDKSIIGGFAIFNGRTVMLIGHQKGFDTESRLYRNYGMPNAPGYRKALRLMKLAEKFNKPIITLIDTPGAYPGIESQSQGMGEAIARNIYEMLRLRVPVISVIIGEGGSGGAMGIGAGDRMLMLQHTWYSVASPESCSAILWHSASHKEEAATQLQLTSGDMLRHGFVDEIIPEPDGGAHWDYRLSAALLKPVLHKHLEEVLASDTNQMLQNRLDRYGSFGQWEQL